MGSTSRLPRARSLLMPILVGVVVAVAALVLKSGSGGGGRSPAPGPSLPTGQAGAVAIKNFKFVPVKLTVAAGTKLTFTNRDSTEHTATADASGGFDTGSLAQGRSNGVVFSKPGTYPYHCAFHAFMTGTVTVK